MTPALAQTTASRQLGQPEFHYLRANANPVHWGYFSKLLKPQVEIGSGDFVTIENSDAPGQRRQRKMIDGDPGAESVYLWTKDRKGVNRRGAGPMDAPVGAGGGLGVHICTGPVAIRDAEPGDVLEVRILDVKPRPSANPSYKGLAFGSNAAANWGYQYLDLLTGDKPREVVTIYEVDATGARDWARAVYSFRWPTIVDPSGVTHTKIDYPGLPVDHSKTAKTFDVLKNIRVPIRPHFGTMGVTPKGGGLRQFNSSGYTGGNIDNWRIGKGATMYIRGRSWRAVLSGRPARLTGRLRTLRHGHRVLADRHVSVCLAQEGGPCRNAAGDA